VTATGYVYVTHSLPVTPSAQGHMLAHRPALFPLDVLYKTRSAAFVATRQHRPYRVPMVCRWTREAVTS